MRLLSILLLAGFVACANAAPSLTDVAYGPEPEQRFDLHAPPGAQAAPLILMVHGGGWIRGDKEMGRVVDNKVSRWLPRGIAFVSINYRSSPRRHRWNRHGMWHGRWPTSRKTRPDWASTAAISC